MHGQFTRYYVVLMTPATYVRIHTIFMARDESCSCTPTGPFSANKPREQVDGGDWKNKGGFAALFSERGDPPRDSYYLEERRRSDVVGEAQRVTSSRCTLSVAIEISMLARIFQNSREQRGEKAKNEERKNEKTPSDASFERTKSSLIHRRKHGANLNV